MRGTSIFYRIEEQLRINGELPEHFEPEERAYADNELRFAPGAMEGILGHHTAGNGEEAAFQEKLKGYLQISEKDALERFEKEEAGSFRTASLRKNLLQEIVAHQEEYQPGKLAVLAYTFAEKGTKCETVKLGLSLLVLFDLSKNEKVCTLLKTLGCCEEFTDYVLMNTTDWEEQKRQDFYFELAKKLKGWGKIDVVEMLEADTEEKKEWILCHGCRNTVMYSYLGYVCAMKSNLYVRLEKGHLTEDEMQGANDIMDGLIEEGPCEGMSALEEPVELTLLYLKEMKRHVTGIDELALLGRIDRYFQDSKMQGAEEVCEEIKIFLNTLDMHSLIVDNIRQKPFECVQIAQTYDMDLSAQIIGLMEEDFSKYYRYAYYLFVREKYIEEFFKICDREVDADKYPKRMGNSLGLGNLGEGVLALDMIVQYLDKYPLKGRKLIEISIQSPIVRWRNMAAKALLGWSDRLNLPLAELDAGLHQMVQAVAQTECNDKTREQWKKLL